MIDKHLRLMATLGGAVVILSLLGGCSSSTKAPDEPVLPDISSPQRAIVALEDAYGERNLEDARYLHHADFTYVPDPAAQIPFLEPGETLWEADREDAILERLLVPERISWLDQVLLEIDIETIDSSGAPSVWIVRGEGDLLLLRAPVDLLQATSQLELEYERDTNGNFFLRSIRETADPLSIYTVSELKSLVEDPPFVNTTAATQVTSVVATLNGTANANGLQTVVWFEWGTDTSYGSVTPEQDGGLGVGPLPYAVTLNALLADTEYHCRIVARSAWGTSHGNDITFTTSP